MGLVSVSDSVSVSELFVLIPLCLSFLLSLRLRCVDGDAIGIPTTLEGPFKPVTAPLDKNLRLNVSDLPYVLQNNAQGEGFQPEQIFVSLSARYDSVWISWITGLIFPSFFYLLFLIKLNFTLYVVLFKQKAVNLTKKKKITLLLYECMQVLYCFFVAGNGE